jgi:hypothetical protein
MAAARDNALAKTATYGEPRDISPSAALLEEVARTAGHVDYLGEQVRALHPDALVWGLAKKDNVTASEFPGINETEAAQINIWLVLYRAERKHLVDVSKAAIAAGIAERQVQLAEQHGRLVVGILGRILNDPDFGVSTEQRRAVATIVRRHLAAV